MRLPLQLEPRRDQERDRRDKAEHVLDPGGLHRLALARRQPDRGDDRRAPEHVPIFEPHRPLHDRAQLGRQGNVAHSPRTARAVRSTVISQRFSPFRPRRARDRAVARRARRRARATARSLRASNASARTGSDQQVDPVIVQPLRSSRSSDPPANVTARRSPVPIAPGTRSCRRIGRPVQADPDRHGAPRSARSSPRRRAAAPHDASSSEEQQPAHGASRSANAPRHAMPLRSTQARGACRR